MFDIIGGIFLTWLIIKIGRKRGWTGKSPVRHD